MEQVTPLVKREGQVSLTFLSVQPVCSRRARRDELGLRHLPLVVAQVGRLRVRLDHLAVWYMN